MTLKDFLTDLADDEKQLKYSRLLQVSGLSSAETAEFKTEWRSVPPTRKQDIVGKLVELCEDNIELDFSGVFRVCLEDADEDVREKATQGLWECDDRAIIRPLIDLLHNDESAKVRAAAGMSLGKFSAMAQNGKLLPRDAERILEALMAVIDGKEADLEVRRRAIEAVSYFDFPKRVDIIRGAYDSGDPKLLQSAIYAMGQSSNTQWLPNVLMEMDHELAAIRYEAANACGQIGDESTVPHLIQLLQDEDTQVQLAGVKALGAIGGALAIRALQQCLKMEEETLVEAAKETLSSMEFDDDPLGFRFQA